MSRAAQRGRAVALVVVRPPLRDRQHRRSRNAIWLFVDTEHQRGPAATDRGLRCPDLVHEVRIADSLKVSARCGCSRRRPRCARSWLRQPASFAIRSDQWVASARAERPLDHFGHLLVDGPRAFGARPKAPRMRSATKRRAPLAITVCSLTPISAATADVSPSSAGSAAAIRLADPVAATPSR